MPGVRYALMLRCVPEHRCWIADVPDLDLAVAGQHRRETLRRLYICLETRVAEFRRVNVPLPEPQAHVGRFPEWGHAWIVRWRPIVGSWLAGCPDLELKAVARHGWRDAVDRLHDRKLLRIAELAVDGQPP